jgi:hypothetical protein
VQEAVVIYQELAEIDSTILFTSDYLRLLNTLCIRLSNADREDDSLSVAKQGVEIAQTISDLDRTKDGQLGHSFILLTNRHLQLGNYALAEKPSERAVEIFRELSRQEPAANQETFAAALNSLFGVFFETNNSKATEVEKECVSVYRMLSMRSDSFQIYLVVALANLVRSLIKFGDPDDLLAIVTDEVLTVIGSLPENQRGRREFGTAIFKLKDWLKSSPQLLDFSNRLALLYPD